MVNEIHLYTFGADPFVLPNNGNLFYIHQGIPDPPKPPLPPPSVSGGSELIIRPTPLPGPYQTYITAPQRADQVVDLLNKMRYGKVRRLGLVLGDAESDSSSGGQLSALLNAVNQYDGPEVAIHLISTGSFGNVDG